MNVKEHGDAVAALDLAVGAGLFTEAEASEKRIALDAAIGKAQKVTSAAQRAKQEVAAAAEAGTLVKLPALPAAFGVDVHGRKYVLRGESHYGKADERKIRATAVVTMAALNGKPMSITLDMLAAIDAKRDEIEAALNVAQTIIGKVRGEKVSSAAPEKFAGVSFDAI